MATGSLSSLEPLFKMLRPFLPDSIRRRGNKIVESVLLLWEKALFDHHLGQATPIFIYQMGKVASTSIYDSLSRIYPGVVLHSHRFSHDHKNWKIRRLYRWTLLKGNPLHVISLTREPIGRNVSSFFQSFERDTGVPYEKSTLSLKELKRLFVANPRNAIPLEWFDKEILKNFGIDVYATPFPPCGFATYAQGKIRLLVMRSEIVDQEKVNVIKQFLELPEFQLFNSNVAEHKEYAETYRAFRAKVKLPPDFISKMCDSKYFRHFYSQEVIDKVKQKWTESPPDSFAGKEKHGREPEKGRG
jgi:hypothetical protein